MENALLLTVSLFMKSVIWQIVMFFLCGIAFELVLEFVKATLFPRKEDGSVKKCPRWLGLVMGVVVTAVYLCLAYAAFFAFGEGGGFLIPGGLIFIPVWAILFFFWQYKSLRIAKWLCSKMFPTLKDPFYHKPENRKQKEHKYTEAEIIEAIKYLNNKNTATAGETTTPAEASATAK